MLDMCMRTTSHGGKNGPQYQIFGSGRVSRFLSVIIQGSFPASPVTMLFCLIATCIRLVFETIFPLSPGSQRNERVSESQISRIIKSIIFVGGLEKLQTVFNYMYTFTTRSKYKFKFYCVKDLKVSFQLNEFYQDSKSKGAVFALCWSLTGQFAGY